jgi:hypothetical protein
MTTQAKGIAEIKSWDEKPYQEDAGGRKLTKASVTQTLSGDIQGEGTCEYLMVYPDGKIANYTGLQVVSGKVGGKQGSFVLQLEGKFDGEIASGTWFVVAGSGTGELKKLQGKGDFSAPHGSQMQYTLEYDFS